MIKKISSPNNYGSNNLTQNNFRRREFDRPSTRDNRSLKYRECGGHGHYQSKCPTYLRRQKKSFGATFSDEIVEEEEFANAFISIASKDDLIYPTKKI